MTDNVAVLEGFTREIVVKDTPLLVKPDTDFDNCFKAWDMDNQEFIWIEKWEFESDSDPLNNFNYVGSRHHY